jgi:two-component system nitrate/nitrite response regulator NarL
MMEISGGRQPAITTVIADSSRMGGQLMATALRRSRYRIAIAGAASDCDGVRSMFNKAKVNVDIAIIAAHLREGPVAGLRVLREIRAAYPKTGFIALVDSSDRAVVVEAFRSGANGILSREEPFERVCKCILAVHQGEVWASARELKFALDALVQNSTSTVHSEKINKSRLFLTKREQGVVELVSEGLTNRDISRQLNLSENTVRNYIFRIFNKVGTSNRLELALYAINRKEGLSAATQE